ncbi:MAG: dethiobiotin synthase [Gammaproteobacteria bacterium]|nr:dethiobiotin synthase [Gammaproteobacteria bacterium]MDH3535336.1 dethiobiotin synthase [Gammaproteobacteria bacterium]
MISPDPSGYFVTGSDTEVGKTYIACQVVTQLRERGFEIETRKPAESGCELSADGKLLTHDAAALRRANGECETIDRIAPFRYRAALAPPRAARLEHRQLYLRDLVDACSRDDPDHGLIVEGAGGFYSPLAEDALNADLAGALQLAVIIVVNDRIGAVNQALMALQAVESRHLRVAAIVLNQLAPGNDDAMDNAADLLPHCSHPLLRCGYGEKLPPLFD